MLPDEGQEQPLLAPEYWEALVYNEILSNMIGYCEKSFTNLRKRFMAFFRVFGTRNTGLFL